ncbi:MAG: winged helix-turn-helix transcriptional regulator [Chloracidobacterium sp.]|nr:winged helix-turn-helix transcriptional regulator [Chloracidobacterium sp.]
MSANTVESDFYALEKLFLALGDKTRLRLLALMADGEVPVGFLADKLHESQPKVSRHLAYLRGAGVVETRRDGKWIYYAISYPQEAVRRQILDSVIKSIAAVGIDQETLSFAEDQVTPETQPSWESPRYVEDDEYELADNYEEEEENMPESEEMDIFLL